VVWLSVTKNSMMHVHNQPFTKLDRTRFLPLCDERVNLLAGNYELREAPMNRAPLPKERAS